MPGRDALPTSASETWGAAAHSPIAVFIHEALTERKRQGRRVPVPALLAIAAASLVGAVDEGIQKLIPSRVFDPVDILFNVLAAAMAIAASVALRRARRWGASLVGPATGPRE